MAVAANTHRGRCSGCGFLGKASYRPSGKPAGGAILRVFEINWLERGLGMAYSHSHDGKTIETTPDCFVHAANLPMELGERTPPNIDFDRYLDITRELLWTDRQCPRWYPYREGFDPAAHAQDLQMMELEQRQREQEERREEERRAFEERLARQTEQAEDRRHNLILWIAVAAIALAIAEVLTAVLSAGPDSLIGRLIGL